MNKGNREQFLQIAEQQPVYAGNLISKKDTTELAEMGYVVRDYQGDCILTRTVFYLNQGKKLTGCYFFGV